MPHPLDGARLKVIRAQEHLNSLNAEVVMFLHEQPHRFESDDQGDAWHLKPVITISPPLRFSSIIGDCVTNLRAALDYTGHQLVLKHFVPAFDAANRDDRRLSNFPITKSLTDDTHRSYVNHIAGLLKRGVPTAAIDEIETVQSHSAGDPSLSLLHTLVNQDKHRLPILTVGAVGWAEVVMTHGVTRRVVSGEWLRDGVTFKTPPEMRAALLSGEMRVETQAAVHVTWRDVAMPYEPVDRTLERIIRCVSDAITRFDQFVT